LVRSRLVESLEKRALRERIRRRIREKLLEGSRRLGERSVRLGMRSRDGDVSGRSRMVEAFLRRRVARLERELERKTRLLKEAYKVVRRVEELGGIDKIEKAMRLAYDTIVKAGSKAFREAVERLARETGVDKRKAAVLVKRVGLKEARDILRKGGKRDIGTKTIIVEGMVKQDEQLPILAMRVAERLSKQVEVTAPKDLKDLGENVLRR